MDITATPTDTNSYFNSFMGQTKSKSRQYNQVAQAIPFHTTTNFGLNKRQKSQISPNKRIMVNRRSIERDSYVPENNKTQFSQFFHKRSIDLSVGTIQPDTFSIYETLPDVNRLFNPHHNNSQQYYPSATKQNKSQQDYKIAQYNKNREIDQLFSTHTFSHNSSIYQPRSRVRQKSLMECQTIVEPQQTHNFRDTSIDGASRDLLKKKQYYLKVQNQYFQAKHHIIDIAKRELEHEIQKQLFKNKINNSAIVIQKQWRMIKQRKWYKLKQIMREQSALLIQRKWKKMKFERLVKALLQQRKNKACIMTQKMLRGFLVRKAFSERIVKVKLAENLSYFEKMRAELVLDAQIKISYHVRRFLKSVKLKRERNVKSKQRDNRRNGKRVAEATLNRIAYGKQGTSKDLASTITAESPTKGKQKPGRIGAALRTIHALTKPNKDSKEDLSRQMQSSKTSIIVNSSQANSQKHIIVHEKSDLPKSSLNNILDGIN